MGVKLLTICQKINKKMDVAAFTEFNRVYEQSQPGNGVLGEMAYFLRPEKVVEKPQKRLIAGEEVYLPVRYVVFSLVRMEAFSSDHEPNKMLISIDIDKL